MTVHGAKGLEAPIVVLIDGCDVLGRAIRRCFPCRSPARTPSSRSGRPAANYDPPGDARGREPRCTSAPPRSITASSTWR